MLELMFTDDPDMMETVGHSDHECLFWFLIYA